MLPSPSPLFDALILGGGPAGLSAALSLSRIHRTCAVFSDGHYRNDGVAHAHNMLSRDHESPETIRSIGRQQIERYGSTSFFDDTRITALSKIRVTLPHGDGQSDADGFEASDAHGQRWRGRSVVLAMGSKDVFPAIDGFAENWPDNIYQCPFCDGHERAHLAKGMLAVPFDGMVLKMASMVKYQSVNDSPVTIFTDGVTLENCDETQRASIERAKALGMTVETRKIKRLVNLSLEAHADAPNGIHATNGITSNPGTGTGTGTGKDEAETEAHIAVILTDNTSIELGFLFAKPPTIAVGEELAKSIGVSSEATPFGPILKRSEPFGMSDVHKVFVAGDAGTFMKALTPALVSGGMAGVGIAHVLSEEDDEAVIKAAAGKNLKQSEKKLGEVDGNGQPKEADRIAVGCD